MRRSDGKGMLAEGEGRINIESGSVLGSGVWEGGRYKYDIDEKRCGTRGISCPQASSPHPFISSNLGPTYERRSIYLCLSYLTISTMYQVCIFNVLSLSQPPHRKKTNLLKLQNSNPLQRLQTTTNNEVTD